MPIIRLREVNKTIKKVKEAFKGLSPAEAREVDFWYQKWKTAFTITEVK